jgi:phage terminase large subunit-like protein
MDWSTACPDWEERILSGRSLVPDLPLFEEEAERALRIFKRLRVPDMIGTPTYGEACGQWVFDIVAALFGSHDVEKKRRMIREFFLLIPKKNAKSSIAAAIMVTAAIMNRRPEAELLLIAPTKKIADIAFKQAAGIIRLDTELTKLFYPQTHQRTITHRITLAIIVIKAADADVITGSKATFILIDETHVFSKKAKAADIFVEIRGSLAARPEGFLLQITTQSKEPPEGVFRAELDIAREVRAGNMILPLLPILYELPLAVAENGGWKDPATWALVNPNLGRSVDEAYLRDQLLVAEHEGPAQLALLASQHFNVQIGLATHDGRWRGADYWLGAADNEITLEEIIARCDVATVGIDGGGLDDLLGLAVIGRCRTTRDWLLWCRAWVQSDVLQLRKDIAQKLQDLSAEGTLKLCTNATEDIAEAVQIVVQVKRAGLLPEKFGVGLDPFGVAALVDELAAHGVEGDELASIGQGSRLSPAVWGLERKLKDGTFWHDGSQLMTWCVGNAKAEQRGNAILITKEVAGKAKIDPLVAAFNAAMLMSRNPEAFGRSVYETRGIRVV